MPIPLVTRSNRETDSVNNKMFDPEELLLIRGNFPILKSRIFLNCAAMAPLPASTRDTMTALSQEQSEQGYLNFETWRKTIEETRSLAARIVGAHENEIAFIRNTSDGVSLVAEGLGLTAGDEVLINDLEFPSNVYPWLNLIRLGVNVVTIKTEGGRITPEMIERAITSRTKVIALSSVQYATGYRADLEAVGRIAKKHDVYFFVDAIQSLGLIPMDTKRFGIDFLACGGHKWLCAPEGIGIFYCNRKRLDDLQPVRVGWHSVINEYDFGDIDFTIKKNAQKFEEGSANLIGIYGLKESLSMLLSANPHNSLDHVLALNGRLCDGLLKKGYKIVSPIENDAERSGIIIFTSGERKKDAKIVKRLDERKIMVMQRGAGIRVAPHFFNSPEDIDALLTALP